MNVLVASTDAADYCALLAPRCSGVTIAAATDHPSLHRLLPTADIVLARGLTATALRAAPRLRWLQLTGVGAAHLIPARALLEQVVVTNTRGLTADVMAEYVLGAVARLRGQATGLAAGIIGFGAAGREIGRRAEAAGMRVVGVRRTPSAAESAAGILGPDAWRARLPDWDVVVLTVPDTPATAAIIGEAELRAMKPTACLINIARGRVVDQHAVVRALRERWIAGAALDVFEREPLPADDPLRSLPNTIVTAHVAGAAPDYAARVADVFADNLRRWQGGRELRNRVDLDRGY